MITIGLLTMCAIIYLMTNETKVILKNIAATLKDERELAGLTQEQLAKQAGISPMTLQFIEQGRRIPSLPMLILLCRKLKLKIEII